MTNQDNQTQFSYEKPLFEAPPPLPVQPDVISIPWYKQPKYWLLFGVAVVILLLVALTLLSRPQVSTQQPTEEVMASPSPTAVGPLEARINQLRTDLQAADPSKQDLPFPPVDMKLQLSTPKVTN